jgi:hypothetical protein
MRKLVLLAHTSLDGYVAGAQGELDDFDASEENLQFVCGLTEQADAALFGRTSYKLLKITGHLQRPSGASKGSHLSTWYNAPKKLISKTMKEQNLNNTIIISDNIAKELTKIKNQPERIY